MKFPALFVNHGGGPLPLLGKQPELARHMQELRSKWLPQEKPESIIVLSAHWESDPIRITSSPRPPMYFDYYGFPKESYLYDYPAPGSPDLARKIQKLLDGAGLESELDEKRGFDHGVFVPLMLMYPEADIPVVCVSLHGSLNATTNIQIGKALASLRDDDILILGSGYTFHNMQAFFNPSDASYKASASFNEWLKESITGGGAGDILSRLGDWESAPGARVAHPREEHLIPLFMTAAAGGDDAKAQIIYESKEGNGNHAVTGYIFE